MPLTSRDAWQLFSRKKHDENTDWWWLLIVALAGLAAAIWAQVFR
jgi:hypothetical protein